MSGKVFVIILCISVTCAILQNEYILQDDFPGNVLILLDCKDKSGSRLAVTQNEILSSNYVHKQLESDRINKGIDSLDYLQLRDKEKNNSESSVKSNTFKENSQNSVSHIGSNASSTHKILIGVHRDLR